MKASLLAEPNMHMFDHGWTDAVMDLGLTLVKHESETCQTGSVLVLPVLRKASVSDH